MNSAKGTSDFPDRVPRFYRCQYRSSYLAVERSRPSNLYLLHLLHGVADHMSFACSGFSFRNCGGECFLFGPAEFRISECAAPCQPKVSNSNFSHSRR